MAFVFQGSTLLSFAEYEDVVAKEDRVFAANESLTISVVEDYLTRSTERILEMIRATTWWRGYYLRQGGQDAIIGQSVSAPLPTGALIRERRNDFTDMCVYHTLSEYIYPRAADFGNPDSAERQKIGFYDEKFRSMFQEIIEDGSWYDFDADGTVESQEKYPSRINLVRVR